MIKLFKVVMLCLVAVTILLPALMYFGLGGNPKLDLFATQYYWNETETNYYQYGNRIYYKTYEAIGVDWRPLESVDTNTFEIINPIWAKDKDNVYRSEQKTKFDPDTFKTAGCYVSDGQNVLWYNAQGHTKTVSTDYPNFELLGVEFLSHEALACRGKDSQYVYKWEKKIEGAHAPSFHYLNMNWAVDRNSVFIFDTLVPEISPDGLEAIETSEFEGNSFVKNKSTVYKSIPAPPYYIDLEADPDTFTFELINVDGMSIWRAADKDFYYNFNGQKIPKE